MSEPAANPDRGRGDGLARLGLLASALAGRALGVASGARGQGTWTDGRTIFVDPGASRREQLRALAVQASLVAAGSLEPDLVRKLAWRPALARRYLGVEGHRALAANEGLLPPHVRALVDRDVAARVDSPAASLAAALGRAAIAAAPDDFGVIHARRILGSHRRSDTAAAGEPAPPPLQARVLAELGRDDDDGGSGAGADLMASPVGGGGPLGRVLARMLGAGRRLDGGGPPGADTPTHRARAGIQPAGGVTPSTAMPGTADDAAPFARRGATYPEWDLHRRRYRRGWCTVHEVDPRPGSDMPPAAGDPRTLRRSLARLGLGFDRCHRQAQGDDLDIDAAIEERVEVLAGSLPDEAVYVDNLRRRRDLSVLVLLDVSGSAAEPGVAGEAVHEHQRTAAAALTVALRDLGDRVALYAFRSQGRRAVQVMAVKRFGDDLGALAMRRLGALAPGAYSRLGAAIRHGAAVLAHEGGTAQRLLVVLSDGIAYDHGYEPTYGAADARRALAEARGAGIGCVCLSIGTASDAGDLRRVFGGTAHAAIPRPEHLRDVIGPLFRSALRRTAARRRTNPAERAA